MAEPRIWTELLTYGLGVALSPIHIVLLLLLLLGGSPLRRGGLFVGGWLLTSARLERRRGSFRRNAASLAVADQQRH